MSTALVNGVAKAGHGTAEFVVSNYLLQTKVHVWDKHQGLHLLISMAGRPNRGSYLIPKKSQLQNLSTQKHPTVFENASANFGTNIPHKQWFALTLPLVWADEKYSTKKKSLAFFETQKILASFIDPEKSLKLVKISDPKSPLDLPPPPPLLNGAAGIQTRIHVIFGIFVQAACFNSLSVGGCCQSIYLCMLNCVYNKPKFFVSFLSTISSP